MDNFNILTFDSGIGGLNVFNSLKSTFKAVNFYYVSDFKNTPYGTKTKGELLEKAIALLKSVEIEKFSAVVLACNTLSTNVLEELEDYFKIKFFGITPPIQNLTGKTLLLSTKGTANSPFIKNSHYIKYEREQGQNLTVFSPLGLVEEIEKKAPLFLEQDFVKFLPKYSFEFDSVILGCTHFIFIKKVVANFYKNAQILDGIDDLKASIFECFGNFVEFLTTTFNEGEITKVNFLGKDAKRNFWLYKRLFYSK